MVAFARAPGPNRPARALRPSAWRGGPLTISRGAPPPPRPSAADSPKAGAVTARTAAASSGRYSGRQPARTALTASFSAVMARPSSGRAPTTVSGGSPSASSNAATRSGVGGTTGSPSVQPCWKQYSIASSGSETVSRADARSATIPSPGPARPERHSSEVLGAPATAAWMLGRGHGSARPEGGQHLAGEQLQRAHHPVVRQVPEGEDAHEAVQAEQLVQPCQLGPHPRRVAEQREITGIEGREVQRADAPQRLAGVVPPALGRRRGVGGVAREVLEEAVVRWLGLGERLLGRLGHIDGAEQPHAATPAGGTVAGQEVPVQLHPALR